MVFHLRNFTQKNYILYLEIIISAGTYIDLAFHVDCFSIVGGFGHSKFDVSEVGIMIRRKNGVFS